jgi:hypothetical protein
VSIAFSTVHGSAVRIRDAAIRSVSKADWVTAVILTAGLILTTAFTAGERPMPLTGAVISCLGLLALVGRRYRPVPAAVATSVVAITSVVTAPDGIKAPALMAVALVAYSVVRYESGGRLVAGVLVCVSGVAIGRLALPEYRSHGVTATQLEVVLVLLPAVAGALVRVRGLLADLLDPGFPHGDPRRVPPAGRAVERSHPVDRLLDVGRSLQRGVEFSRTNRDRVLVAIAAGLVVLVVFLHGLRHSRILVDEPLAREVATIVLGMITVGSLALIGRRPWPALLVALVSAIAFTGTATLPHTYNNVIGGVVVIGLPLILGGLLPRIPGLVALGTCLAAIVVMRLVAEVGVDTYNAADSSEEVLSSLALAVGAWSTGRVLRRGATTGWTRSTRPVPAMDDRPEPMLFPEAEDLMLAAAVLGLRPTTIRVDVPPTGESVDARSAEVVRQLLDEALANAARHAPGAELTITMRPKAAAMRIDVVNGPAVEDLGESCGPGRGIPTLAAGVADVGGMLWVGPAAGGFALRARIPLRDLPAVGEAGGDVADARVGDDRLSAAGATRVR